MPRFRRLLLGLLLAATAALPALPQGAALLAPSAPREMGRLEAGRPLRQSIPRGSSDQYLVSLPAGHFAHVVVHQEGMDLVVSWLTPDGKPIVEVDSPNGSFGPEPISLIAESAGDYRLEVRSLLSGGPPGRYEIVLRERRAADETDRLRVAAQSLHVQGQALRPRERRRAAELYGQALELWRRAGARDGEVRTLFLLAAAETDLGDNPRALEDWNAVVTGAVALAEPVLEGDARINRSDLHRRLGNVGAAASDLEAAAALFAGAGEEDGRAAVLASRSLLALEVGDLQTILDASRAALEIHRRSGNRTEEATSLNDIATAYRWAGYWDRARSLFEQALDVARSVKDARNEAIVLQNLGNLAVNSGDPRAAVDHLQKALVIRRDSHSLSGEAVTLTLLGKAYHALGNSAGAREAIERALALRRELGERAGEAPVLDQLALLASEAGEPDRALGLYEQALSIEQALGQRAGEANTLHGMARVLLRQGRPGEAWGRLKACLDMIESLRAGVGAPALRATFLGSVRDYYDTAVEALMREGGSERVAQALETSERGRARTLVESILQETNARRREAAPRLVEKEVSLRRLLAAKADRQVRLLSRPHTPEEASVLAREIDELTAEYDQTLADMRRESPSYAMALRPPVLSASDIQQLVPEDGRTVLVEYALGEERSYAWTVSRQGISSVTLPRRAEIEAAVRKLRDDWSGPASARALSDLVIAPLSDRLLGRRIIVVPDGALHYVPFAALPVGSGQLIDQGEVSSVPAASVLALLRQGHALRGRAAKTLAVLADPVFEADDPRVQGHAKARPASPKTSSDLVERSGSLRELAVGERPRLARLLSSRMEARAILARVAPTQRLEALDFRASRATALGPSLANFRIVHFATHGFVDSAHPELSGIVLSLLDAQGREQPGVLSALDVFNLGLRADLVVLSGCETALGREIRGEGPMSLARGFLHAGASAVVASLWNVDDFATTELMKRFYSALLGPRHLGPAGALRAAQLEMREQGRWREPRFWAGFVVYGAGD